MDVGKIIIGLTMALVLIVVIIAGIELTLPLYWRIQLDEAASEGWMEAQANEGLSREDQEKLRRRLERMGLSDVKVDCPLPGGLERFEQSRFVVRGQLSARVPGRFLMFESVWLSYEYERFIYGRRIIN